MFKKNLMFERLKNLYLYHEICDPEELDSLERITLDWSENKTHKVTNRFYFNSNLGTVKVELDFDFGVDGTRHYLLWYSNYAGSTVFKLDATKKDLSVTPLLGEELMAQDIDLALYELESYLQFELGSSSELQREKELEMKEKLKLHNEQLKILKG